MPNIEMKNNELEVDSTEEPQDLDFKTQIEEIKKQAESTTAQLAEAQTSLDNITIRYNKLFKLYADLLDKYLQGE